MYPFKRFMVSSPGVEPAVNSTQKARLLSLLLAMLIVTSAAAESMASYSATVLADTPAAYWRLGETSGNVAFDSSANGRHATYLGPILGQSGALVADSNSAVLFSAYENDSIQRVDSTGLIPGLDSWAVEAWVKVGWSGKEMEIVSWYPGGYEYGRDSYYKLSISSHGLPRYLVRDVTGYPVDVVAPASVADDSWHHLVGVIDRPGSKLRLYVDGAQVAAVPLGSLGVISDAGTPLNIGLQQRFWTSDYRPLEGRVDEVALYRSALSAERVLMHYQVGRGLVTDSDQDGVLDATDTCPDTPAGVPVNASGCQIACSQEQMDLAVRNAIAAKDAVIAEKDALLAQKESTISSLNADVNSLLQAAASKDELIASLNEKMAAMYGKEQLDAAVQEAEAAKDAVIGEKESVIADLTASVIQLQQALASQESLITKLQQDLAAQMTSIGTLNAALAARDQKIAGLSATVAKMYTQAQLDRSVADATAAAQDSVMRRISANLAVTFDVAPFVIPGGSVDGQIATLTRSIDGLPKGQKDKLKQMLAP